MSDHDVNALERFMNEGQPGPKISPEQLAGWPTLAQAYRELQPGVTYHAFRARVLSGKSVVEAGTMPRSRAGRPVKGRT
jgi:hypothetical protein